MTDNELMKGIKSLEEFKKQFKHTSKDKIIEMFYEMGLELIKLNRCCDSSEVDGNNLYFFDKEKFANILKRINDSYPTQTDFSNKTINRTNISQYINMRLDSLPKPNTLKKIAENSNDITTYKELMKVCGYI